METNNITYKKCSFELAKLLKEHNYGYDVDFWYDADGNIMLVESEYKAPLLARVKSWLRDKKYLDVTVTSKSAGNGNSSKYYYVIDDIKENLSYVRESKNQNSEEECLEEALMFAIDEIADRKLDKNPEGTVIISKNKVPKMNEPVSEMMLKMPAMTCCYTDSKPTKGGRLKMQKPHSFYQEERRKKNRQRRQSRRNRK
jgi:hypothetical protein